MKHHGVFKVILTDVGLSISNEHVKIIFADRNKYFQEVIKLTKADEGQEVMVGDRVAVMEAMKMQTPIISEIQGIITGIFTKPGAALKPGDKILKIDQEDEDAE